MIVQNSRGCFPGSKRSPWDFGRFLHSALPRSRDQQAISHAPLQQDFQHDVSCAPMPSAKMAQRVVPAGNVCSKGVGSLLDYQIQTR